MTGDTAYEERAAALSCAFSGQVALSPAGYGQLLSAVDFAIGPSLEIVIVGEAGADDTEAMLNGLRGQYLPNKIVLLRTPGDAAAITDLAEFTRYQYVSFAQDICRKSKHIVQFICTMAKEN